MTYEQIARMDGWLGHVNTPEQAHLFQASIAKAYKKQASATVDPIDVRHSYECVRQFFRMVAGMDTLSDNELGMVLDGIESFKKLTQGQLEAMATRPEWMAACGPIFPMDKSC